MTPQVEAAWIAGAFSLTGIAVSAFIVRWNQRKLAKLSADLDQKTNEKLADLNARLDRETRVHDAELAYRFDALKRLYAEVRPLLFQLAELCESSNDRLSRILRHQWTMKEHWEQQHLITTTYRLFAPLVIVRQIQGRLTAVDLELDPKVRVQYLVARELLFTLHNGRDLASCPPEVEYRVGDGLGEMPRQHLTNRYLDALIECMTVRDQPGASRLIRYSELSEENDKPDSRTANALKKMEALLAGAGIDGRPVLWRILIAQAFLQEAIVAMIRNDDGKVTKIVPDGHISRYGPKDNLHDPAYGEAVTAVESYLEQRLKSLGCTVESS
jgi:hypothetical protein